MGYDLPFGSHRRTVRLISRQGKEFTQRFPELAKAVSGLGAESITLDTEVAVFDRQLISRFVLLLNEHHHELGTGAGVAPASPGLPALFQGVCPASSYSQYPARMFGRHHPPVRSHLALSSSWL